MPRKPTGQTRERVYRYMRDRLIAGQPPTVREIRDALGLRAAQTVQSHLKALVTEGRLQHEQGRSRGYRLADGQRPSTPLLIPLIGQVQAGSLTTALEEPMGYIPVHGHLRRGRPGSGAVFALRVRGDNMRNAGILPGDIVVVRRQQHADNGDVVVALIGDEATVKTWRRCEESGRVELHPENPDFEPIVPDLQELELLGKVIEIRRYLEASVPIDGEVT